MKLKKYREKQDIFLESVHDTAFRFALISFQIAFSKLPSFIYAARYSLSPFFSFSFPLLFVWK